MCPFPFPISLLRGPASLRQRQELFLKDLWLNCRGVFLQQTPWSALCCVASYYGHSELSTVAHTLNNILSSHQPAGQFPERFLHALHMHAWSLQKPTIAQSKSKTQSQRGIRIGMSSSCQLSAPIRRVACTPSGREQTKQLHAFRPLRTGRAAPHGGEDKPRICLP